MITTNDRLNQIFIDNQPVGQPMIPPLAFLWTCVLSKQFPTNRIERRRVIVDLSKQAN